jgi:hypothetical protein
MEMVEEGLEVVKPRSDWTKESVVSISTGSDGIVKDSPVPIKVL